MKSANVHLGKDLRAKIADFGFVRATTEERERTNRYQVCWNSRLHGTGIHEGKILSRKADVYSFGVNLLELIRGEKAYDNNKDISQDYIAMWFEKRKEDFWNSIEVDIDTDHDTQQSIKEVAELAGSCCGSREETRDVPYCQGSFISD
ncbi:putative receptor protein kinase TMK1 [Raphanus sativus]|nr:putative receptor protein kinase TMK1 [Raphanus sativus]